MSSDLLVVVSTVTGQTDVLISNTRTHPSRNSPSDVQWKSEWETGGASASGGTGGGGGLHRLHISYTDPLFLAGPYYIAIYAWQNATFHLNATVEQVARQIELARKYGAAIATTTACTSDADCTGSSAHQLTGAAGFACIQNLCSQQRRFRFRPHVPAHAYHFRVEAVPPLAGFITNCSVSGANCPCAPLRVYVTKGRPYPDGVSVGAAVVPDTPTASEAARPGICSKNHGIFFKKSTKKFSACLSATRNSAKSCRVADSIRGSAPIYTLSKSLKLFFKKSTKTFQQALLRVYHKKFLKNNLRQRAQVKTLKIVPKPLLTKSTKKFSKSCCVSFAEYCLFYRALLQKRSII